MAVDAGGGSLAPVEMGHCDGDAVGSPSRVAAGADGAFWPGVRAPPPTHPEG